MYGLEHSAQGFLKTGTNVHAGLTSYRRQVEGVLQQSLVEERANPQAAQKKGVCSKCSTQLLTMRRPASMQQQLDVIE